MAKNLTEAEFWWMIGILEGEGYFGYHSTQRIAVSMTDHDTMLKVAVIFEKMTGKVCVPKDSVSEERQAKGIKRAWVVDLYGDNARTIMHMVVPHMSARRRQRIWQSLNGFRQKKANVADILALVRKTA